VREVERRRPEDDPACLQHFDERELVAEFGHCLRDLGRPADAAQWASCSVGAPGHAGFARSDFFATAVLADAQPGGWDLEQGRATASRALTAGELIRAGAMRGLPAGVREASGAGRDATVVTGFGEQARGAVAAYRVSAGQGGWTTTSVDVNL
jgi:hypothetical protein